MDLVIREMVEADVARVCELLRDCYRWLAAREGFDARQSSFLIDQRSSEATIREESRTRPHFVACRGPVIVGMSVVHGNELARLYVDPHYHRQGVGKALFDAAEAFVRDAGHQEMTVAALVDSAASFYLAMGMSITGRQVYEPDIFLGREVIMMTKKLAAPSAK